MKRLSLTCLSIMCLVLLLGGATMAGRKKLAAGDNGIPRQIDPSSEVSLYWQKAKQEVYKSVLEINAQHETEVLKGIAYRKFMRGNPVSKRIAITFDDGPHPNYTPKLLDILAQFHAKATFFVVGEMAERYPYLVEAEYAAGHQIGNHTYHHVNLTKIPDADIPVEIQACTDVIKSIIHKRTHVFRPPGGDYDRTVADASARLGCTMVLWTDDPGDYASPGDRVITTRLLDKMSNGGIILIHDGVQQTIDVLPQILRYLQGKGYEFVTIDQLMKRR